MAETTPNKTIAKSTPTPSETINPLLAQRMEQYLEKGEGTLSCKKCGSKRRTDRDGGLFCPVGDKSCPFL